MVGGRVAAAGGGYYFVPRGTFSRHFRSLLSPYYRHTFLRRKAKSKSKSKSQPHPTMNAAFREAAAQARQKPVLLTQNQEVNIYLIFLWFGCWFGPRLAARDGMVMCRRR